MSEAITTQQRLNAIFAEKLNIEVPSDFTDLLDAGLLDSLSLVELLLQLEQEFGLRISLEDLSIDNFRSINSIAHLVGQVAAPSIA